MSQVTLGVPVVPSAVASQLPDASTAAILSRAAPLLVEPSHLVDKRLPLSVPYAVVFVQGEASEALDILNNGAEAIVTPDAALLSVLPPERIIFAVDDPASAEQALQAAPTLAGIFYASTFPDCRAHVQSLGEALEPSKTGRTLWVSLPQSPNIERVKHLVRMGGTAVAPLSILSFSNTRDAEDGEIDFADLFFCALKTDRPDGLYATVVSSLSGQSLGLVYSSSDSLRASLLTGDGIYQSRTRGLWHKGLSSGATQSVRRIRLDCDLDAVEMRVEQHPGRQGEGFCHMPVRSSCFGSKTGLEKLQDTITQRKASAPAGSYTARLFSDKELLSAKIREEAQELVDADDNDKEHVAFEMADLLYFAMVRCVKAGVTIEDVERALEGKAKKVQRRPGNAKPAFLNKAAGATAAAGAAAVTEKKERIALTTYHAAELSASQKQELLQRPAIKSAEIQDIARPIIENVRTGGDKALLEYTAKFDKCTALSTPVVTAPYVNEKVMAEIKPEVKEAIDVAFRNIYTFHAAQKKTGGNKPQDTSGAPAAEAVEGAVLEVETQPGVVCRRFARPVERVGLYVPGGTAVLPSTALMLGVPALVAGSSTLVLATPPRPDGSIVPEVLYVASLLKATCIVAAGGAQAVAAMAYGTETVPKVDKIAGPGNQFVTAAKMLVANDSTALVGIDMPAGPSEVLVIADKQANPAFVASDLLSQAEHGVDSMVVLVAIDLADAELKAIDDELDAQAHRLPRVDTVRVAISKSITVVVKDRKEAIDWSNAYAPEHLILQVQDAEALVADVTNAGSVFVGAWSPESCGDYASGTNHTLPTYGFARQYSGVSTSTFEKNITSQSLTAEGLLGLGPHVVHLAECEGLEAHAQAVRVRLAYLRGEKPPAITLDPEDRIHLTTYRAASLSAAERQRLLQRPAIKSAEIQDIARPIIENVRTGGDKALLEYTAKFDKCTALSTPVVTAPYVNEKVMAEIKPEVKEAIDVAFRNIYTFHAAQKKTGGNKPQDTSGAPAAEAVEGAVLEVETQPGVVCRRFARPVERVGLYVPGGTAVLPSTALMLGVPALVAGSSTLVLATPPRPDGSIVPEVLYVASLLKATCIVAAGGAQAVAAMAYGTETVPKVDKIAGPGNQFVTAAKMLVANDSTALVGIDMPAGPSEVLVIADKQANPAFVASDLLSQAEHGVDSMVVLVAIDLADAELKAIDDELDAQAHRLPRVDTVRVAISKSITVVVKDRKEAIDWSNAYAPEHLILQVQDAEALVADVTNAGSVFVGAWSPESCGDYASGTNHTLPTYGYARQYSGVSTSTFEKHITSQSLTADGLRGLGPHVVRLAECEGLEAHAQAVRVRLASLAEAR